MVPVKTMVLSAAAALVLFSCPAAPVPGKTLAVIATETWSYSAGGSGYFVLTKYEDNSIKVTSGCVTDTSTGTNIICTITSGSATLSNTAYWEFEFKGDTANIIPACQFQQALDHGFATNGYVAGTSYLTGFMDAGYNININGGVGWTGHLISGSNITSNF